MLSALVQTLDRELTAPAARGAEASGGWRRLGARWLFLASHGDRPDPAGHRRLGDAAAPAQEPAGSSTDGLARHARHPPRRDVLRRTGGASRPPAELATAATIGWRRPLILLPDDWQTWDEDERRAVLAHELAHVCRGDFLTGLLAQLSLALQFYHPLAHWLSARLRLEQELAADAWTARLSGGNLPYLTTLARMALRRDDRVPWAGRPVPFSRPVALLFGGSRCFAIPGGFVMSVLSASTRFLTVGALACLGLLVGRPARADWPPRSACPGGSGRCRAGRRTGDRSRRQGRVRPGLPPGRDPDAPGRAARR